MEIALISMPFAPFHFPSIGISLLQAELRREKIPCDVYYLDLLFASRIGCASYSRLGVDTPMAGMSGEWVFSRELFGAEAPRDEGYAEKVLRGEFGHYFRARDVRRLQEIREQAGDFLDDCMDAVPWPKYDLVGFTSSFQQTVASLALAKRVKENFGGTKIAFGGANCEGEMGIELHRQFPIVDYVCSGEGDRAFPELVRRLESGEPTEEIPGIITRNGRETIAPREIIWPVSNLDDLPYPCYDDYFEQLGKARLSRKFAPYVPFETSRGCWWGQKMHCTFCGLNRGAMAYRSKSAARALEELDFLGRRYGKEILSVDTILDLKYLETFFPELVARKKKFHFYFETKVNLSKEQMKLLRDAGIRDIQPGIESLSTAILKLMKKGCSLLQNVQFLKWCGELGLKAHWNVLYGFPGEPPGEYAEMARIVPQLTHLDPPMAFSEVRMDRFSPYFTHPRDYGLTQIRAHRAYSYVYPFERETLANLAYYFEFSHAQKENVARYAGPAKEAVSAWMTARKRGQLRAIVKKGTLSIVDTRVPGKRRVTTLREPICSAYIFCDRIRAVSTIQEFLAPRYPASDLAEFELSRALDDLVTRGLMLKEGKSYLSLAILPAGAEFAAPEFAGETQAPALQAFAPAESPAKAAERGHS